MTNRQRSAERRMTHRRADDHVHPDYWARDAQHRFEDRVGNELNRLREDLDAIGQRLTLILGGIAVLAFLAPLLSPLVASWLGVPVPPTE